MCRTVISGMLVMSRSVIAIGMGAALQLTATLLPAQGPALEFAAEAVRMTPGQQPRVARIYVGDERVRMEYLNNGQQVVEIIDWGQGYAMLLLPDLKTYMQSDASADMRRVAPQRGGNADPCQGAAGLQCRHLGQEIVEGRNTDKWEMLAQRDGRTERSLHWFDQERQMPLRQWLSDGTLIEMNLLGRQLLDGREVEHWRQVSVTPEGATSWASQWYDPQLQIAIREELPGGYYRELRDIRIAAQPEQLFEIPAGYRRVEPPTQHVGDTAAAPSRIPAQR